MSNTFNWCKDKTKLAIWNKQVFCVRKCGDKVWYFNGRLHRENGPAMEYITGDKVWWWNGELHRENGPAIENADGDKYWYLNGERHRENGPAVEWANGSKFWYLNDVCYLESDYWKELKK